jgi:hypothetical protein
MQAVGQLKHANIVRALDAEQMGGLLVLVMEYVPGVALDRLVKQRGPLPVAFACRCVAQAALGLQHAHEKGLVHRDIKPGNLLVTTKEKEVKVLDFGLVRGTATPDSSHQTQMDAFMGTPDFCAPEQASDARSADIRADVYSLGCTLYYLLAAHPPFRKSTLMDTILAHIQEEPQPVSTVRKDVPAGLWAVLAKMLAKKPADRYQTPLEVAKALQPFTRAEAKPDGARAPVPPSPPPGKESTDPIKGPAPAAKKAKKKPAAGWRRPLALGGIAAGVVALALGAWLLSATVFKVKVKTPEGEAVVVLEIDQPGAEVSVDGNTVNVTVPGEDRPVEIKAEPGLRSLRITKEGFVAVTRDIELTVGKSKPIRVHLEPVKTVAVKPPEVRPPEPPPPRADDFVPLFNGKDLEGWKTLTAGTARWEVRDGVLVGSGGKGCLFNVAGDHGNLHLRAEVMINDGGNAAVCWRTLFGPTDSARRPSTGFAVGLNLTHKDAHKIGSIYYKNGLVVDRNQSPPVEVDQWFTLEVIAEGPLTRVRVNGKGVSGHIDLEGTTRRGRVALAILDSKTVLKCRKFEVKDLPSRGIHPQYRHPGGVFDNVKGHIWLETAGTWHGYFRDHSRDNFHEGGKVWMHRSIENNQVGNMHITRGNGAWWNVRGTSRWTRVFSGNWTVAPRAVPPMRTPAAPVGEWVPLFNGKDLKGWETAGNKNSTWTYEGEALVGRCGPGAAGLLLSDRVDYDDFHLRMEAQLCERAIGSLFLRCGPPDDGFAGNKCYAVRIGDTKAATPTTGTLVLSAHFDEAAPLLLADAKRVSLTAGEWFWLEVRAEGKRLQVFVKGTKVVDFQDTNNTFTIGRLGLVCRATSVLRVRKVEVKELPAPAAN